VAHARPGDDSTQRRLVPRPALPKFARACSHALNGSGLPLIFAPEITPLNIAADYSIPVGDSSRIVLSGLH